MRNISKIFILLFVALLGFSSCGSEEPIGKWENMKWTNVDNLKNVNGVYLLPAEGGTYTFLCRNYEQPWISSVTVNGEYPEGYENSRVFNGEWFTVKFEGNKLIITVQSLPQSLGSRGFDLMVTAGDIFDKFIFNQQRNG